MIIYVSTKDGFLDDVAKRDIEDVILSNYTVRTGRSVPKNEKRAWKESLPAVAKVLTDDGIPGDCGVAVEYGIQQSMKRIDFIVSGRNAQQRDQFLIVELKQWQTARSTAKDGIQPDCSYMRT